MSRTASSRRSFAAGQKLIQEAEGSGLRVLADAVSARQRGVIGGYHLDGVVHGSLADIYKWTEAAHHTLLVSAH